MSPFFDLRWHMKGLCITSIFTSGSGSFPPVTNTNSDANNEQRENKIILIDNSTYSWEVDEITSISLSLSTEFKIKTCKECHTWHPTSATNAPTVELSALLHLQLDSVIPKPRPFLRISSFIDASMCQSLQSTPRLLKPIWRRRGAGVWWRKAIVTLRIG